MIELLSSLNTLDYLPGYKLQLLIFVNFLFFVFGFSSVCLVTLLTTLGIFLFSARIKDPLFLIKAPANLFSSIFELEFFFVW